MRQTFTRRQPVAPPMMRVPDTRISEVLGHWWLLHTKPRNEKALAWQLFDSGLDYFLPLVRVPRKYGRQRVEVLLPLFPGYVFLACASEEDRYRALATKRLANALVVVDQARLKSDLEQIRRVLTTPHKVDLYPGIKRGRRCRVAAGSLKGLEGVVIRRRDTGRIFLDVSMLGQSAVVELDVMLLERVD